MQSQKEMPKTGPDGKYLNPVKQFVFLRNDIESFGTGALAAQVSHATVGAIHKFYNHPETTEYLERIGEMTTVIYKIKKDQIEKIQEELGRMNIDYYTWIENFLFPSCISTRPIIISNYPEFEKFKNKFRLF